MAERAIVRHSRRERNKTNVHRVPEEMDRAEVKRRSRSEGPNRRVRQSMDEREVTNKKQSFDGGGSGRRGRCDDSLDSNSDNDARGPNRERCESDSDSDPKHWTKNPLVVRRTKKSGKDRNSEKRLSGTADSGGSLRTANRSSWVYHVGEDQASSGSLGGGNSSSRDNTGSGNRNKFQKLEEMRKKRINLAVTSDEENTPASRISRLRQRAIQSGLGEQARPASGQELSTGFDGKIEQQQQPSSFNENSNQPVTRSYQGQNLVNRDVRRMPQNSIGLNSSRQIAQQPQQQQYQEGQYDIPSRLFKDQNRSRQSPSSSAPQGTPVRALATYQQQLQYEQQQKQQQQQQQQQFQQQSQSNQNSRVPSVRGSFPATHNVPQSFHTIPEPNSQTARAIYNSSPETNRRFTHQARVPSVDSVLDSNSSMAMSQNLDSGIRGHTPSSGSRTAARFNSSISITPPPYTTIQHQQPQHQHRAYTSLTEPSLSSTPQHSRSPFNEVVEMRLKSAKISPAKSRVESNVSRPSPSTSLASHNSDDSLDELIESNIQFLDREIDKARAKRLSGIGVARSSSLPDPRKSNSQSTSITPLKQQPILQVQQNSSVQLHVSLNSNNSNNSNDGTRNQQKTDFNPPLIQIARSSSGGFQDINSFEQNKAYLNLQPDVVPRSERKFSYDNSLRLSRPNSEYFEREDLSKSDSQLNAPLQQIPNYRGNNLHPDQVYARGCVSDVNLTSTSSPSLEVPLVDKGMFSDVDYDIEVSERVKKWEKYMKKQDILEGGRKNVNLTPIEEKQEGESLMLPSEVRKSIALNKQGAAHIQQWHQPVQRVKGFNSDTSINRTGETGSPKVVSIETNAHRFFQVIQDPMSGPRLGHHSQSVNSVFQTPITITSDKNFPTAQNFRQQLVSNRQPALALSNGPLQASYHPPVSQAVDSGSTGQSQDESSQVVKRGARLTNLRDPEKRSSRYQEELDEITTIKGESVVNLRRRFDTDSTNMTSEDEQRSVVSTASAKLSRGSKLSPSTRESESVDWASMIPGYQNKIKESDVWSPNLESTQGVPVSIERVKARTLQTIPFSEDPFWKEIEELTSFDPNAMAGHLSVSSSNIQDSDNMIKSQATEIHASPHSSTLPSQPKHALSSKERLQRSKSLYTPNITPLTINIDKTRPNPITALDDVLDDIRSSMERQQQFSPKKRNLEKDPYAFSDKSASKPGYKMEGGQLTFYNPSADPASQSTQKFEPASMVQMRAEQRPMKQPLQFYQRQQQNQLKVVEPLQGNRQSQVLVNNSSNNNYQLDPALLKQKLLNTGLVVETDTEDASFEDSTLKPSQYSSGQISSAFSPDSLSSQTATLTNKPHSLFGTSSYYHKPETYGSAPQSRKDSILATSGTQSGSSALDDIQRALAKFKTPSYQPGPESLYGTTKFESFKDAGYDTTRGSNTSTTSWSYQAHPAADKAGLKPFNPPGQSSSRLQQVTESMDDLKELAQNVERRINMVKSKLHSADENSLDSILSSLKKFSPDTKTSQEVPQEPFEEFYNRKKAKLTEALSELDRISTSLDLDSDHLSGVPKREKMKPYRPTKSSDFILAPQPKSHHLRPMQMRISSVYIPGLENKKQDSFDTETEFDIISKSFQAIADEVNRTSDLYSQKMETEKMPSPENTAPETQKQTYKITLKAADATGPSLTVDKNSVEPSSSLPAPSTTVDNSSAVKAPPVTAPKPQSSKTRGGRFRAKIQEQSGPYDESNVKKVRSKSVPDLELSADILDSMDSESTDKSSSAAPTENATSPTLTMIPKTGIPVAVSTPPLSRPRTRIRPVKDNRIMQEDRAAKKEAMERTPGMPQSPQPSPKVLRKVIYNNNTQLETMIQPPTMFQDAVDDKDEEVEAKSSLPQLSVKQQAQMLEGKAPNFDKKGNEANVSLPASTKKMPPPVSIKPLAKVQTISTVKLNADLSNADHSKVKLGQNATNTVPEKSTAKLQSNMAAKPSLTSSGSDNSATASTSSTASLNLTPPVLDSNMLQTGKVKSKSDASESEGTPGTGALSKGKRKVGAGVALMMDKFSSSEEGQKMKPGQDLTGPTKASYEEENNASIQNGDAIIQKESPKTVVKATSNMALDSGSHISNEAGTGKTSDAKPRIASPSISRIPVMKVNVNPSLERKVLDPDGRGSTGSSPSSPSTKPPLCPWKRQTSDPETPPGPAAPNGFGTNVTTDLSGIADKKNLSPTSPTESSIPERNNFSKGTKIQPTSCESPPQGGRFKLALGSPKAVIRRIRPHNRKIQTESPGSSGEESSQQRPHSFHELIQRPYNDTNSCSELKKFPSDGTINAPQTFRTEHDLGALIKKSKKDLGEVVLKFDLKMQS